MVTTNTLATREIRDTNSEYVERITNTTNEKVYHYKNDLDAEVTITVYGTLDEDLNKNGGNRNYLVQLNQQTVSADSAAADELDYPWSALVFKIVATSSPTTDAITVTEMEDN